MVYLLLGGLAVFIFVVIFPMLSGKKESTNLPSLRKGGPAPSGGQGSLRGEVSRMVNENPPQAANSLRAMMDVMAEKKKSSKK